MLPGNSQAGQREQHFVAALFRDQIEGRRENAELHFAFFHRRENAGRIGVGMLDQLDVFVRIDFQPVQSKSQSRVGDRAEGRADMAGLAFEVFDFLDAFLRHDLVRKDIDPGADQDKRRRAFEGGRHKSGGARAGGHLHFAGEHRLHRGGGIGFDDFDVEPVFFIKPLIDRDGEKSGARIHARLAERSSSELSVHRRHG